MAAINYKSFTLNSTGDDAPWSDTEVQFHKDIVDTCVKDCYSATADMTNGHRHYRLYDTSGTVTIRGGTTGIQRFEYSASIYTQMTTDSGGDTTIKNTGGDIYFADSSGNAALTIENDRDYIFTLGDAAAARKLYVKDSADVTQASIDSDGNAYFKGKIYSTDYTDWSASASPQGWTGTPSASVFYIKLGQLVWLYYSFGGTSNSLTKSFTLPFAVTASDPLQAAIPVVVDGTATQTLCGRANAGGSATCNLYKTLDNTSNWTSSGTCNIQGYFVYRTTA
jgi:hypothetical protein